MWFRPLLAFAQQHNPDSGRQFQEKGRQSQRSSRNGRLHLESLEHRLAPAALATSQIQAAYGQIPLSFEINQGQTDSDVDFLSRGSGYALFLTPAEAVLSLQKPAPAGSDQPVSAAAPAGDVLRMQLIGGNTRRTQPPRWSICSAAWASPPSRAACWWAWLTRRAG
jgi:hypothetical protein